MTQSELTKDKGNYIDLLKVLLTFGIICRHATLSEIQTGFSLFDFFIKVVLFLSDLCVPLFFALSGYLFFLNVPKNPTTGFFVSKLKNRFFSLVIPYVIANCIAFAIYWITNRAMPSMLSGFMGDDWKNPLFIFWTGPVNLSLWFLRDLIVACLCAPVFYLLIRYIGFWSIIALGLWSFFHGMNSFTNFYFALGAFMSIKRIDIPSVLEKVGPYLLLLFICSAPFAVNGGRAHLLSVFIGLPLCMYLGALIAGKLKTDIPVKSRAWCYFVYLYHYLLIIGLKKILCMLIPQTSGFNLFAIYILSVLVTLVFVTIVYLLMSKWMPNLTSIVLGGKS